MAFEKWAEHVLVWEGGYVNDPSDSGGATNKGVTWNTFTSLGELFGIAPTENNFRNLTNREAKKFYYWFWTNSGAPYMENYSIGSALAEMGLMSGSVIAVKTLQDVLNRRFKSGLVLDGILGSKTALAANSVDPRRLFDELINYRGMWLESLAARRPKDQKFLTGWLNRLKDFKKKFDLSGYSISRLATLAAIALIIYKYG